LKPLWSESAQIARRDELRGERKTEALIVGGGLAGLLCAYWLREKGVDYILAEGGRIGAGVSAKTTAKITSQHGLIYSALTKSLGDEKARQYLLANEAALQKYRELCRDWDCDFEEKPAFVYSTDDRRKIEKEVETVNKLGGKAEFTAETPLPVKIAGAVKFANQAQFHPLKFIRHLAQGLNIYENTFIRRIEGRAAFTEQAKISAGRIVIATHFPFLRFSGGYFVKMYQHRSYALALSHAQDVDGMWVDEKPDGLSFRNYQGLLILGGGDHRTGKQGGGWRELRDFAAKNYPAAEERFYWATQDCMTLDGMPYIGRLAVSAPRLYAATGFNKWGMTSSMLSGMILSDLLCGRENEFAGLFSPRRFRPNKQFFLNGLEAATNLLKPSGRRCTHLGCALKWNKEQRSWDCPCHGSRFGEEGRLLENPAVKGAKV